MAVTWPAPPAVVDHAPSDVQVLVALPTLDAWGHGRWGVAHWGGYGFTAPFELECHVEGLTVERGRNDPMDHIDPGGVRLRAQDPDMVLTPWVIPADGLRRWRTGVPIKVRTGTGDLFTGAISRIQAIEDPRPDVLQVVDIDCRDALSTLAASNQVAQSEQGAGELAGARMARVVANARPPGWVETDFDEGVTTMQATTLAQEALAELWLTADSDAGMVTCTPDGVVRFWDEQRGLTEDRRVTPQVLFTDDPNYGVGWKPSALPGLVCWLDASTLELDEGAPVTTWPDRSGHGHDAHATAAPPTYHATGGVENGPSVRFAKPGTPMTVEGLGAAITGDTAYTLIVLLKTRDTSAMNVLLTAPTAGAWGFLVEFVNTDGFDWGVGGGASLYGYRTAIPTGTEQLWSFVMDTTVNRHDLFKNGALLTAFIDWGFVPAPIPALGDDVLLGVNQNNGGPLDADVAAVLWYDRTLSDAERQQVEDYLQGNTSAPVVVCATSFEIVDDAQQVTNTVSIAAKGGTAQVAQDLESVSWNGVKTTQRHDLIHAAGDARSSSIAQTMLTRVTRESVVVTPLKFDALHSVEAWNAAHSLDVGDRVAVHRSRGGHRLDITAGIDEIRHDVTPYSWFTTITLSPGTQRSSYSRWSSARWGQDDWS